MYIELAWTPQLQQITLAYHRSKHREKIPIPCLQTSRGSCISDVPQLSSLWVWRGPARDQKEKEPEGTTP